MNVSDIKPGDLIKCKFKSALWDVFASHHVAHHIVGHIERETILTVICIVKGGNDSFELYVLGRNMALGWLNVPAITEEIRWV